jgi:hypothetical protein
MKQLILMLFLATNALAQKDSIVVLNKEVSINWTTSLISKQEGYFNARFSFEFHNATFKGFYVDNKKIKSTVEKSFNYVNNPDGIIEYTIKSVYSSAVFLKYIKNKKIYTIEIPLKSLPQMNHKQEGGNSVIKS